MHAVEIGAMMNNLLLQTTFLENIKVAAPLNVVNTALNGNKDGDIALNLLPPNKPAGSSDVAAIVDKMEERDKRKTEEAENQNGEAPKLARQRLQKRKKQRSSTTKKIELACLGGLSTDLV